MRPLATISLLAVSLAALPARAETLAEAAAREAARRQQGVAKKATVYTDGELVRGETGGTFSAMLGPPRKAGDTPAPSTSGSPAGVANPVQASPVSLHDASYRRGGRTESEWRAAAADLRTSLGYVMEQVEIREENLRGNMERQAISDLVECVSPGRAKVSREEKLRRARAQVTLVEQKIEELVEEARRHNIPPSWVRQYY